MPLPQKFPHPQKFPLAHGPNSYEIIHKELSVIHHVLRITNDRTTMDDKGTSLRKTTIAIEGMHCAACVAKVEKALRAISGVSEASVNFGTEQGTVTYDAIVSQGHGASTSHR